MSAEEQYEDPPQNGSTHTPVHRASLWESLTDPGPSYLDPDEHRRAKLLAAILVIIFPLIIMFGMALMPMLSRAPTLSSTPTFIPATFAAVVSIFAFFLNRSGRFRLAAIAYALYVFLAAPLWAVSSDLSQVNIAIGTLPIGSVILVSILLPEPKYSYIAAFTVTVGTLLLALLNPSVSFIEIGALFSANVSLSVLLVLYSAYRNQIEQQRRANLKDINIELRKSYEDTLEGWSRALEFKDKFSVGHAERVTELTLRMAAAGGIMGEELVHIYRGALLHDIGKIGIPDYILFKTGKLDDSEMKIVRLHPIWAYEMLEPISFLRPALPIPYSHHEKWDGSGYPQRLSGKDIPFAVRLFSVADVFDALMSDRPYRQAWDRKRAQDYLREQAGTHFDPECVDIFFEVV